MHRSEREALTGYLAGQWQSHMYPLEDAKRPLTHATMSCKNSNQTSETRWVRTLIKSPRIPPWSAPRWARSSGAPAEPAPGPKSLDCGTIHHDQSDWTLHERRSEREGGGGAGKGRQSWPPELASGAASAPCHGRAERHLQRGAPAVLRGGARRGHRIAGRALVTECCRRCIDGSAWPIRATRGCHGIGGPMVAPDMVPTPRGPRPAARARPEEPPAPSRERYALRPTSWAHGAPDVTSWPDLREFMARLTGRPPAPRAP